jgi:hypothetical protein
MGQKDSHGGLHDFIIGIDGRIALLDFPTEEEKSDTKS